MASRYSFDTPVCDSVTLKAVDAILCKQGWLLQEDIDRIAFLVKSSFKPEDSPVKKAKGCPVVASALAHRLTNGAIGFPILQNCPVELIAFSATDPKRALYLAACHPAERTRDFLLSLIDPTVQYPRMELYEEISDLRKSGKLMEVLYPTHVYKAYEKLNSSRLAPFKNKNAGQIAKDANKDALETGIESAKQTVK